MNRAIVDVPLRRISDGGAMCRQLARQMARVLDDPRYDRLSMPKQIDRSVDAPDRPPPTDADKHPLCYSCRTAPAGHGSFPLSAYCGGCYLAAAA